MRKWIILLAALMLFIPCAQAEEQTYYTNHSDLYYHANPDCDRPPKTAWYGTERTIYEREIYRKYPISATAAEEFEKKPCPVCAKGFQPTYLGEHMPAWTDADYTPWGAGKQKTFPQWGTQAYRTEVSDTYARFEAYFEEVYDRKTDRYARKHPYPDAFAGLWFNNADGYTYAIVDPSEEILAKFREMFGGGAWIVPAKYGENEMREMQEKLFDEVRDWCAAHPELDATPSSASVNEVDGGFLEIGLDGADWQKAAAEIDAEMNLPVWVMFHEEEMAELTEF